MKLSSGPIYNWDLREWGSPCERRNGTKRTFNKFKLLEIDLGVSLSSPCFCVVAISLAKMCKCPE